ncbi:hypothetical protein HOLleu_18810 [Holothuria leucospilota]|uniref:Ig-like domain-containing protein n=1 Tax=Holothuria leucospilota TaxID=206669 RepID=A0A9Q1C3E7_HOLLE|nr:hypothetical protein HOLleu_18810 [Holothuria leucospilota]
MNYSGCFLVDNITFEKYHHVDNKFKEKLMWPEDQSRHDVIVKPINLTDESFCLTVCIQNVSNNDSGIYRCKSGNEISNEVEVTVKSSTEDVSQHYRRCLGQKSPKSTDKVTLTCISKTSRPEEPRPRWFKNGSEVMQDGNFSNISLGSSSISFISVEATQNDYTCGVNGGKENLSCEVSFSFASVSMERYADKYIGVNVFISLNSHQMYDTVRGDSSKTSNSVCSVEEDLFFSKGYNSVSEGDSSPIVGNSPKVDYTPTADNSSTADNSTSSNPGSSSPGDVDYISPLFIVSLMYVLLSTLIFIVVSVRFIRRHVRLRKFSHIYATFNPAVAPLAEIPRRNLSRRPTRSLPPIPTEDAAKPDAHYANAHLKLSQHSLPANFRHSMQSFPSDSAMWKAGCRNSLPLHSSNVSAQNALYFFTETVEECDETKECTEDKPAVIPYTFNGSKPRPPKPFFKHHTMNVRSSTLVGKPRASDYQNWFQRFKLSTSCPSIAGMEEAGEVKARPDIVCQAKISFEKWKKRTQIRRRLSSIYRERSPPPAAPPSFLPTLQRPFSESFAQSENPYVERGSTMSSCYSK